MTLLVKNTSFEPAGHGPVQTQNVQTRKKTKKQIVQIKFFWYVSTHEPQRNAHTRKVQCAGFFCRQMYSMFDELALIKVDIFDIQIEC